MLTHVSDVVLLIPSTPSASPANPVSWTISKCSRFWTTRGGRLRGKRTSFQPAIPPEENIAATRPTQTAQYLIDHVGAKSLPTTSTSSRGATIVYKAEMNGFHVYGYAGMTNQDHFDHLFAMHDLMKQTSLSDARQWAQVG